MRVISIVFIAALLGAPIARAWADDIPYVPTSDDQVLEHVSKPSVAEGTLRAQQSELAGHPTDLKAAAAFARIAIAQGNAAGDPRYFGYAQSALQPWWHLEAPPAEARLLRAIVLQWQHQFDTAKRDLDAIITADDAFTAQARLTRASVEMVQGAPDAARRDCAALIGHVETLIVASCIAAANAVLGPASAAESALQTALTAIQAPSPDARAWAATTLGEIGAQLGHAGLSRRFFADAIDVMQQTGHRDPYLLAAYSDFLLDQGDAAAVTALLSDLTSIDNLLLRQALAEDALGRGGNPRAAAQAKQHAVDLASRFRETRERGDFVHQREEALYLLKLKRDPAAALAVASDNWQHQKELIDARVLLEAAAAAGDIAAATPAEDWIRKWKVEDVRLEQARRFMVDPK